MTAATPKEQFRVAAAESKSNDPFYGVAAPRLVLSCVRCGSEIAVNDRGGSCTLGEITGWTQEHTCPAPPQEEF